MYLGYKTDKVGNKKTQREGNTEAAAQEKKNQAETKQNTELPEYILS